MKKLTTEIKLIAALTIGAGFLTIGTYLMGGKLESKINENNNFIGMIDNRVDDLERNDVRNDLLLLQEKVYEKEIKEAREILRPEYGEVNFTGIEFDRILFYSFDLDVNLLVNIENRTILIK